MSFHFLNPNFAIYNSYFVYLDEEKKHCFITDNKNFVLILLNLPKV